MSTRSGRQYKVPSPKRSKPARTRAAAPKAPKPSSRKVGNVNPELLAQWTDLQASFARAFRTYVKGERASALPLFRSVIDDCERMRKEWPEESLSTHLHALTFGSATIFGPPSFPSTESHHSWSALYADALAHTAVILGRDPHLRLDSESNDESFRLLWRAVQLYRSAADDKGPIPYSDPRSSLTWLNVHLLASLTYDWARREDDRFSTSPDFRMDHSKAQEKMVLLSVEISQDAIWAEWPSSSATGRSSPQTPNASTSNEGDPEPQTLLPSLTPARVCAYFATRLLDVVEDWDSAIRSELIAVAHANFALAIQWAVRPFDNDALYAAVVGEARVQLLNAQKLLPDDDDCDPDELVPDAIDRLEKGQTRLREVIPLLEKAEEIAKECAGRDDIAMPVNFEDARDYIHDALRLLVEQGARNDEEEGKWRTYAEENGYDLSDSEPDYWVEGSSAEGESEEYGTGHPTEDDEDKALP